MRPLYLLIVFVVTLMSSCASSQMASTRYGKKMWEKKNTKKVMSQQWGRYR